MRPLCKRLAAVARVEPGAFDNAGSLPAIAARLRDLARHHDVIHLNSNHPCSRIGIGLAFGLGGSGPLVSVEHRVTPITDIVVPRTLIPILPRLFQLSRRNSAKLIAVSHENAVRLNQMYGIPQEKITVIHNGISFSHADASISNRHRLRAELGLGADQKIVLVLARIVPNKGHHFLVKATPTIVSTFPNVHFVFAGALDDVAPIEHQINELGLQRAISILGFRTDTADLLAAADVLVLPSLAEGFSLSIVEALASGVPVVATDVGGAQEAINDGVNGFIVPPADSSALAQSIIRVLTMGEKVYQAMSESARKSAELFSVETMAQRTYGVYLSVLR